MAGLPSFVAGWWVIVELGTVLAATPPVSLDGRGGDLSGREVVRVKRVGRAAADVAARLRLGDDTYLETRGQALRASGTFARKGKGGRSLVGSDDATAADSLAAYLARRTRDVRVSRARGDTAVVVSVDSSAVSAKLSRAGDRIVVKRRVRFQANAPVLGETWRGTYTSRLAGTLGDVPAEDDPTTAALNALGVSTAETPRLDSDGQPLDAAYAPVGATLAIGVVDELLLLGVARAGAPSQASVVGVSPDTPAAGQPVSSYTAGTLFAPPPAETPWAVGSNASTAVPAQRRAAAAGDLDGDGLDEVMVVHVAGQTLSARVIDDAAASFVPTDITLGSAAGVVDVNAVAADVDGDGTAEVVVALTTAAAVELRVVGRQPTGFAVRRTVPLATRSLPDSQLFTSLDAGNVDRDAAQEVAVVVNEGYPVFDAGPGLARILVVDDGRHDHAVLHEAVVRGEAANVVHTAAVADVALGDVDGDGMDEVVLGGLENLWNGGGCDTYGHVLAALDDARHGFATLGARAFDEYLTNCDDANPWRLRYVHVVAADVDGDGAAEVAANWHVYDDWRAAAPWTDLHQIPLGEFFDSSGYGRLDRSTASVIAADVTGDGRADVVAHRQDGAEVFVYHDDVVAGWGKARHAGGTLLATELSNSQTPDDPILVRVNATPGSGRVLRHVSDSHRLVFTEPVVIAALAAPPCGLGIGQATGDCRTQYGTAVTSGVAAEATFTISAGAHVGAKGGISILGVQVADGEVKKSISGKYSLFASAAYSLEKTVVFTTGPLEDGVVFTTVPFDQHTYRVVSDPDPAVVGTEFVLSIPREPITLLVERGFFNDTVPDGRVRVGDAVFAHTVGVPRSYPTASDRNARLAAEGFAPLPMAYQTPLQSVGQGAGNTSVSLGFEQLYEAGAGYELEFKYEAQISGGGAMSGFEVGTSFGATLAYSKGSKTVYSGTVGNIDAANFGANQYSFGLFAYAHADGVTGQKFEVVNYWVE